MRPQLDRHAGDAWTRAVAGRSPDRNWPAAEDLPAAERNVTAAGASPPSGGTPWGQALLAGLLLALVWLLAPVGPALAQNYDFAVPQLYLQVYVNPDASARLVYDITFENSQFGSAIDIVDIGTPHDGYDIGNMSASLDGRPLSTILPSTYIDTGVEIHLQPAAIPPEGRGTLHVEFTMPDMVYQDTTNGELASLQITPTWFDPTVLRGTSDIWVVVHMLPGVPPEAVLFQDVPFTDKALFEEHTIVGWRWPDGRADQPYLVGVSFPQTGMSRVIEQSLLDLARKWLEDNPTTRLLLGAAVVVMLGIAYFRFSGGTGLTVFVVLAAVVVALLATATLSVLWLLPAALASVGLVEWRLGEKKARYLPAIAQVEGGGIKRGLTAPEAAVLLELPLNKILLLVIFGLLEKMVVRLEQANPLQVTVTDTYLSAAKEAKHRRQQRRKKAQEYGIVLRDYEHAFIEVLQFAAGTPVHKLDFNKAMKGLIDGVVGRMKGFDLSDTQEYYRRIISRAMEEAGRIGEVPELEAYLDRQLPWIMMDDNYGPVLTRPTYNYHPVWMRPLVGAGSGTAPAGGSVGRPAAGGRTSFGDVAAAFAGWTENQAGQLATAISPASVLPASAGGFVNLSGVDRVTGDVFEALSKASSSGSGGSGGGCACACAGCACACACAGGGR